jgi:hypothetical protein
MSVPFVTVHDSAAKAAPESDHAGSSCRSARPTGGDCLGRYLVLQHWRELRDRPTHSLDGRYRTLTDKIIERYETRGRYQTPKDLAATLFIRALPGRMGERCDVPSVRVGGPGQYTDRERRLI